MNLEEIFKYLLWIFLFAIALIGLYALFKSLGAA